MDNHRMIINAPSVVIDALEALLRHSPDTLVDIIDAITGMTNHGRTRAKELVSELDFEIQTAEEIIEAEIQLKLRTGEIDFYEFIVGDWWIPAFLEGDTHGLSEEDLLRLEKWKKNLPNDIAHWDTGPEVGFTVDSISGLHGNCVTLRGIIKLKKEN